MQPCQPIGTGAYTSAVNSVPSMSVLSTTQHVGAFALGVLCGASCGKNCFNLTVCSITAYSTINAAKLFVNGPSAFLTDTVIDATLGATGFFWGLFFVRPCCGNHTNVWTGRVE